MPSVGSMLELIGDLGSSMVTVHQDRCVLVRNRNADCLRCAQACTSGCISYDGTRLEVSPERCIGCGTCATVCPTCALEAHHPNDAALLARCRQAAEESQGVVCVACAELLERAQGLFDEDKLVRVECLGRVDESLLSTLAAEGIREVVLAHGSCETCNHATGYDVCKRVCATQRALLDAWHSPMKLRLTRKLPTVVQSSGRAYDMSKRSSLKLCGAEGMRMGAAIADLAVRDALQDGREPGTGDAAPRYVKVMDDGTLPHFLPDRRERLLDALAAIGDPEDVMIDTRLWGHVIIDTDICTSCRMCATFCPTGALSKFQDENGSFGVEHYPGDCVKCRTCEVICPAGALSISEEVFAVDMLAGVTDRYKMKPVGVKRGDAHTIWHVAQTMMKTDQVYER
ncbi:4Fe-4S binding protein [Curtanaerobium respiraculi]|uniref:4Fe-4S binding protein n=1 Tax=Curtanaerobium respiraculi TaxID=2949669 RepID=UPI0024B34369|nr:4Fe-4S binding protein [Curtanaerobium respiraculi]